MSSTFLAFWELMTLVPAAAILVAGATRRSARAVYAYLAITHLGGAGVWVAMLVLAHHGAIGDPAALAAAGAGAQTLVAVAALIGFGTKAGLIPLHAWLPRAHPVAPAPPVGADVGDDDQGRALRADPRRVRVARRDAAVARASRCWRSAAVSALGGVLWALVQHDLKRLLAYHSIENVGIIALGLGASLLFADAGERHVGGDRVRGGAAARRQPRDLQGAAVPRRRRVRARRRQPRPRPARRAAAADAVDRRRVPGRLDGDRRAAAAERLRVGVADAPVAAARRAAPAASGVALAGAIGARRRWPRRRRSRCCAS